MYDLVEKLEKKKTNDKGEYLLAIATRSSGGKTCIWEQSCIEKSYKRSLIVCGKRFERLKPMFISYNHRYVKQDNNIEKKQLDDESHGLFSVYKGYHLIGVRIKDNVMDIKICKIFVTWDNLCLTHVKVINEYHNGKWKHDLKPKMFNAVSMAILKASFDIGRRIVFYKQLNPLKQKNKNKYYKK